MPVISALEKIVNSRPAWAILKQQNKGGQNDSADKGAGHHTWWLELKQKMTLARCPLLSTFIPWLLCVYVDSIQSLVHDRRAIYQGPHPQTPSLLCVSNAILFSPGTTSWTACHKCSCRKFFVFIFHQFEIASNAF